MLITKKISDKFAKSLVDNSLISPEFEESYSYCIDFALDLVCFNASLLILGAIFHNFLTALVYIISLVPLKMVAGGAHANTRLACSIISYVSFGLTILLSCVLSLSNYVIIPIFFISLLGIVTLAPVEHENKRFEAEQKKKLKNLSIVFSNVLTIGFFALLYFGHSKYCLTMTICVVTIFINQLIGKLVLKLKENK